MAELNDAQLYKFLAYGQFLGRVEGAIGESAAVDASIALQRDAGNFHETMPITKPVTQERVKETLGALYLAYVATGQTKFKKPLQTMMCDLGMNPSSDWLRPEKTERGI